MAPVVFAVPPGMDLTTGSFRFVATAIFAAAVLHTFLVPLIKSRVQGKGRLAHLLGELELVFALWALVLAAAMLVLRGWPATAAYFSGVHFTEPVFVLCTMAVAGSRPILALAEALLGVGARLGGGRPAAWWFTILTVGPLLGSLITEPAAMTISALLLARRFFVHRPSPRLAYATLGLLFVNVSIGGALTPFAAPPIVMVAGRWGWGLAHVFFTFGVRSAVAILLATLAFRGGFRRELSGLRSDPAATPSRGGFPWAGALVSVLFLTAMVGSADSLGGLVLLLAAFLGAAWLMRGGSAMPSLREPALVGLFLAGIVVHGGLQGWWIAPLLTGRGPHTLFFGAGLLTSFNDNAAITYLATFVPGLTDPLRQAVVAGAIMAGGLTVIANAPNPAGAALLAAYFPDGVSPAKLALAALVPTAIAAACFLVA